jgi:Domain of unknown function (DUF4270)
LGLNACFKNDIELGDPQVDSYTRVIKIDTVGVEMSTVLTDSFPTSGRDNYLLGRYKDTAMGITSGKIYLQLGVPDNLTLPNLAQYDSIALFVKRNKYFYGDTTSYQTIVVKELSSKIEYSYASKLYNTSAVPEFLTPLGQKTVKINPTLDDAFFSIKLSDVKGNLFFSKIKQNAEDIKTNEKFLQYFKGISLSFLNTDTTMLFGVLANYGSVFMRIYYHQSTPFFEKGTKDFPLIVNDYSFNQLRTNRSGTALFSNVPGKKEFPSSQTNKQAFSQTSTGVLTKITFPSLKNILYISKIIKPLRAELILKPVAYSFNATTYKLPPTLFLYATDASNIIGGNVYESNTKVGSNPFVDNIYNANSEYRFVVTDLINALLQNSSTAASGVYLMEDYPGLTKQINRALFGNKQSGIYKPQLIVTVLTTKD